MNLSNLWNWVLVPLCVPWKFDSNRFTNQLCPRQSDWATTDLWRTICHLYRIWFLCRHPYPNLTHSLFYWTKHPPEFKTIPLLIGFKLQICDCSNKIPLTFCSPLLSLDFKSGDTRNPLAPSKTTETTLLRLRRFTAAGRLDKKHQSTVDYKTQLNKGGTLSMLYRSPIFTLPYPGTLKTTTKSTLSTCRPETMTNLHTSIHSHSLLYTLQQCRIH